MRPTSRKLETLVDLMLLLDWLTLYCCDACLFCSSCRLYISSSGGVFICLSGRFFDLERDLFFLVEIVLDSSLTESVSIPGFFSALLYWAATGSLLEIFLVLETGLQPGLEFGLFSLAEWFLPWKETFLLFQNIL